MRIVEYTGIHKEVIDAVNLSLADGPLSNVRAIVLTAEEMKAFMKNMPFKGGVGKFYGDADVPALMHVEYQPNTDRVMAFYLNGVRIESEAPVYVPEPEPDPAP